MFTWKDCKSLLCVRLDNMGDVLMTSPAIRAISETYTHTKITLLTSTRGSKIGPFLPGVHNILTYDAPWVQAGNEGTSPASFMTIVRKLKTLKFDGAIIFTVYSQNPFPGALLVYQAGIPLRLGFSHHNPYQLLTHWIPDPEPQKLIRHEVERQLDLVAQIGCYTSNNKIQLSLPKSTFRYVNRLFQLININIRKPWIILHPGASDKRRIFSPEIYSQVMKKLTGYGVQILLTGTKKELEITEYISKSVGKNVINLCGKLNLFQLITLIKNSPLLISNNTGPVHIAAAVQTPVIVLYANTNPQHVPWKVPHKVLTYDVPCQDCQRNICDKFHSPILKTISVSELLEAIIHFLPLSHLQKKSINNLEYITHPFSYI